MTKKKKGDIIIIEILPGLSPGSIERLFLSFF